jgi:hypothetical protein
VTTPGSGRLLQKHGPAAHPGQPPAQQRPDGASDATVDAIGKLSSVLDIVEQARGELYAFHRLMGNTDRSVQDAVQMLRDAGHDDLADEIGEVLIGRDATGLGWSFQLVESFDDTYWQVFREADAYVRDQLGFTERHVWEAELRHREQQPGPTAG